MAQAGGQAAEPGPPRGTSCPLLTLAGSPLLQEPRPRRQHRGGSRLTPDSGGFFIPWDVPPLLSATSSSAASPYRLGINPGSPGVGRVPGLHNLNVTSCSSGEVKNGHKTSGHKHFNTYSNTRVPGTTEASESHAAEHEALGTHVEAAEVNGWTR